MAERTDEQVGFGFSMEVPGDVSTEKLWEVMLIKIKQPELFLPVTDVVWRPTDDGRAIYREMSMGPHRMIEDIFSDSTKFEVNFVVTNASEPEDHINVINIDAATGVRSLEFYKRHSETKGRTWWAPPKKMVEVAMNKMFDMARAL